MSYFQSPQIPVVATYDTNTSGFEKSIFIHANTECPICLEPIVDQTSSTDIPLARNITVLNCYHVLCNICLMRYIQKENTCPICRKTMFNMSIIVNPQTYIIPPTSVLGQRLRAAGHGAESARLLSRAAPLRASRNPVSRDPVSRVFLAPRTRTRSRSPIRRQRIRDITDNYPSYNIDENNIGEEQNVMRYAIYRSIGHDAAIILFVLVDIAVMAIWLTVLWYKRE